MLNFHFSFDTSAIYLHKIPINSANNTRFGNVKYKPNNALRSSAFLEAKYKI